MTSCNDLEVGCAFLELVIPDHHYNVQEDFEGKITDFETWWQQFSDTSLGKLFEIALDHSPVLERVRNDLREVAYKYGMKEESVDSMVKNLDEHIKLSIISPASLAAGLSTFSATHVITGDIPKDFEQGDKNYFRLFKLDFEVDLFGKHKSWKKSAEKEILAVIESFKDAFSILRIKIASDFIYIISKQIRHRKLKKLDCNCHETVRQIKSRVEAGVQSSSELNEAKGLLDEAEEKVYKIGMHIKQSYHSLLENTGITDLATLTELMGDKDELPKVDQNILVGTPMNVIQSRPDIRLKLDLFEQVCGLIGLSLADRFPSIVIESVLESTAKSIFDMLKISSLSFAYGYHFSQNTFEQAKVTAKTMMYKSQYKKAQSEYKNAVSKALAQVGDAMVKKALIEREIVLVDQKQKLIEEKLKKVHAKVKQSSQHLLESLKVESEKFHLKDKKIVLESEDLIATMKLVRSLGG